jgi:hypothetical protein
VQQGGVNTDHSRPRQIDPPSVDGGSVSDSQADSAGSIPVTRSTREKRCSTSEFAWISQAGQDSFASETALVPLRVPLAILASAPADCQFPS